MDEVRYCEKCGHVGHVLFNKKCKNCKIKMKVLPEEIKQKYNIFTKDWSKLYSELHMLNGRKVIEFFKTFGRGGIKGQNDLQLHK